ncbi:hypothetical protein JW868_02970 [Candidatus Woesearchaeota archaeon]|nr:hypothetical protein [Candidatus Woesearchaeota archaeon]
MKQKKHMTRSEEFEIMKMVLDKFLWLGVGIMAYGFYKIISLDSGLQYGLMVMFTGAILLILFISLLVKEYHYVK